MLRPFRCQRALMASIWGWSVFMAFALRAARTRNGSRTRFTMRVVSTMAQPQLVLPARCVARASIWRSNHSSGRATGARKPYSCCRLENAGAGLAGDAASAFRGYRALNRRNATKSRAPLSSRVETMRTPRSCIMAIPH